MPKYNPFDALIKRSTRRFVSEGRKTARYSFFDLLHGYIYGRWIYLYIRIGVGEHPISKPLARWIGAVSGFFKFFQGKTPAVSSGGDNGKVTFAEGYHGKVVPLEAARQLVMVNEPVNMPDLEHILPYQRARDIILQNPDHIVVIDCPCRSARQQACLPMDVCLVVGEPFASFVVEHQPEHARWITQAEAEAILRAEHGRGHVQHAFFKDAMLNRFYAICNCCACCCGAMQSHRGGTPMLASSGYVTRVDSGLCIGCGTCQEYCQFGALSLADGCAVVDSDRCMGCGVCSDKCDLEALSLEREPSKGEPLEIFALMDAAASGEPGV